MSKADRQRLREQLFDLIQLGQTVEEVTNGIYSAKERADIKRQLKIAERDYEQLTTNQPNQQ